MVTDGQVRVLRRKLLMEGKTQEAAAAGAGMSVRSARQWQAGPYPSQARKPHLWRTRPDPLPRCSTVTLRHCWRPMRGDCWKDGRFWASSIGVIRVVLSKPAAHAPAPDTGVASAAWTGARGLLSPGPSAARARGGL
jgi:hypothetical protein